MKIIFNSYKIGEDIPVKNYLKKRKLVKYFNREISSAIVCLANLLDGKTLAPKTPFYYAKGKVEYEDYGLEKIVEACKKDQTFSQTAFVEKGLSSISPLTQFKVLYNMPLSFISIEYKLTGDNAVLYSSAYGLYIRALTSKTKDEILLGAGKVYKNGTVETGFALCTKTELENYPVPDSEQEAIELFREWKKGAESV